MNVFFIMNERETIIKISEKSGIHIEECEKVLKALEDVLDNELSSSNGPSGAVDIVYNELV